MSDTAATEPVSAENPAAGENPAPADKAPEPKAQEPAKGDESPWANPDAAKAEIERLRRENAASRTNAKAAAAEEARQELAQSIGKALGLVEDETIDPVKLTENLTSAQADAKRARVELAVFRHAESAGGDPAALLDSASFLEKVANLDPSDSSAIADAIKQAVEANPRLGADTDPQQPAPNPAQGASASGPANPSQLTRADLESMTPEQIDKAHEEGRLTNLLSTGR